MMKKLLIFMLVLGLASTASALTISLTSGGKSTLVIGVDVALNGVITVDLKADTPAMGISGIDFQNTGETINAVGAWVGFPGGFALVPGTLVPVAGGLDADIMRASGNAAVGTEAAANTVLYSFNVTVSGNGTVSPVMLPTDVFSTMTGPPPYGYWFGAAITQNALTIIPEPMTIALLGLGGLLLRRRK